ncbi:MAG TPA: C25 family cysteine peptidase [Chitinispirillaceae bacterium]|nr:C25 family cysteine peptidase [Chitinispirillaceae bacterium]
MIKNHHPWFSQLYQAAIPVLLLLFTTSFSQDKWIPFTSGQSQKTISSASDRDKLPKPSMNLADGGLKGVEIDYEFPGALQSDKIVNSDAYQFFRIDAFGMLGEPGKPALPSRWYTIAVPDGMKPVIKLLNTETVKLSGYTILPALKPAADKVGAPEPSFEIDSLTYHSNSNYPQAPVIIRNIQRYRGKALARIQVCPVQYNPVLKTITVFSRLNFKIEFLPDNQPVKLSGKFTDNHSVLLSNIAGNSLTAYPVTKNATDAPSLTQLRGGYLIITTPTYKTAADTFALWKSRMGYTVSTISQNAWTTASVNDSIHNRYAVSNPPLEFCAIIGDHPDVPARSVSSHVTDLYYACMDGSSDFTPDIAIGRISVSSASEAMTVIQKIVNYERNPISDASFYQNGLCAAYFQHAGSGYAERRFAQTSWEIEQYLINQQGYGIDREFYTESSVSPRYWNNGYYSSGEAIPSYLQKPNYAWDGDAAGISASINAGRFLVSHRDHGDVSLWGDPRYTTSNINSLTNGNKLPVVLSINCLTGTFNQSSPCFSEVFLRHPTGGAVGVIGATEVSYSGQNDAFAEGLIDAIWPDPGLVPLFPHNRTPVVTPHESVYQMGLVLNQGKMRMSETWNAGTAPFNYEQYTYELFHFFGDPSMHIWTAQPANITVSAPSALFIGQSTYTISGATCLDGVATLLFEGSIIGTCPLVNGNGTITLNPPAMSVGTATLTITAHNYRPLQQEINVLPPGDAIFPTSPAKGILYDIGEDITVQWQSFGTIPNVRIEFSSNNGTSYTVIAPSITNTNSYTFTAPSVESDLCLVRVSDIDDNPSGVTPLFSIHNLSTISGTVAGGTSAQVFYSGTSTGSVTTTPDGDYTISRLFPGTYSLFAQVGTYRSATINTTTPPDRTINFTIDVPAISVSPLSLQADLAAGDIDTQNVFIRNTGNAVLDYTVSGAEVTDKLSFLPSITYDNSHFIEIPKGEPDPRVGLDVTDSRGGPDVFGYTWIDSDEPGGPVFTWTDIVSTGTLLSSLSNCDDCYTSAPIGFSFPFYGTPYSTMYVSTNGYITFGSGTSQYSNYALPGTNMPVNLIAGFFDDLSTGTSGNVYYQNFSSHTIVQFQNIGQLNGSGRYTFQIVLWSDGKIEIKFRSVSGAVTSSTTGIQNGARNDGLLVQYNTTYVKNSLAITFRSSPSWLHLTKAQGSVAPGESDTVGVIFNSTELDPGTYLDSLLITHNAPTAPVTVPCMLVVDGMRRLSAIPSTLSYGQHLIGTDTTGNVILENTGTEPTTVNSIIIDGAFTYTGPVPPFTVPSHGQVSIPVHFLPDHSGPYSSTAVISSNAEDNPVLNVNLTGSAFAPASFAVNPSSVSMNVQRNTTALDSLLITNAGDQNLTFSIEGPMGAPWLSVTTLSGTIPGSNDAKLYIEIDANELSTGTFTSTFNILHNGTNVPSPVVIPVEITVFQGKPLVSKILAVGPSAAGSVKQENLVLHNVLIGSASSGKATGSRFTLILK